MVPRTLNASAAVFLPSASLSFEKDRLSVSKRDVANDSIPKTVLTTFLTGQQLSKTKNSGQRKPDIASRFDGESNLVCINDSDIKAKWSGLGVRRVRLNDGNARNSLGEELAHPAARKKSRCRSNRGHDGIPVENRGTDCQAINGDYWKPCNRVRKDNRCRKKDVCLIEEISDLKIPCEADDCHEVQIGFGRSRSIGQRSKDHSHTLRNYRVKSRHSRVIVSNEELEVYSVPVCSGAGKETAQTQINEYPHLPKFSKECDKLSPITNAVNLHPTSLVNVDQSTPSYLAISSRCLKDASTNSTETADDLTSIGNDTGWYYGNAVSSKQQISPLHSRPLELDLTRCRDVPFSNQDVIGNQPGSHPREIRISDKICINKTQAVMGHLGSSGKRELVPRQSSDEHGRNIILYSGSKSAAEKWKSRWLEIARQQSALQREQLQSPSLPREVSGKDWHSALSPGSDKTAPYSFLYSADRFANTDKQPLSVPVSVSVATTGSAGSTSLNGKSVIRQFSKFRWWSAIRLGDYATVLGMIVAEKIKLDSCFCYNSHLADSRSIISIQRDRDNGQDLANEEMTDFEKVMWDVSLKYARQITGLGADVHDGDENHHYSEEDQGLDAMHVCAKYCHPVLLEHLLRSSSMCCIDSRERKNKLTALHIACQMGHLECARILLLHGADPDCRDKQGDTALHKSCASTACPASQAALVSFLCERGKSNSSLNGKPLKVNTKNKKRETALMFARTRELVVILIGAGADPYLVSYGGLDAACMAARRGDSRVLEAILSCNSFRKAPTPLTVGGLFSYSTNPSSLPNSQESCFTTPLHEASKVGSVACTRVLLCARFNSTDLNSADRPGSRTPLMLACDSGHSKVVQELLDKGADTECEDRRAVTAIVIATRAGHLSCVRAMIGARPNCLMKKNSVGENVLEMYARLFRQDRLAKCPCDQVLSIESSIDASQTHIHAVEQSLLSLADLIMHGAVVTERFVRRFSCQHTLELLKRMKITRLDQIHDDLDVSGPSKSIGRTYFEAEAVETMWQMPAPSIGFCDVTFKLADDERCLAHSFIVSSCSASLGAMLRSNMLEHIDCEDGVNMRAVSLSHHAKATFLLSLEWMYTLNDVTDVLDLFLSDDKALLLDLLYQSNELLMNPLQHLCEHAIGRHLDHFDKHSVLTMALTLNLRLLLTYYWKRYPSENFQRAGVEDLTISYIKRDAQMHKERVLQGDPADDADAESFDLSLLNDSLWGDMGSTNAREGIMRGRCIEDFIAISSDEEWRCWLAASSLQLTSASPAPIAPSEPLDSGGNAQPHRALEVDRHLAEDCFVSWWYRCLVGMAIKQSPSQYQLHLDAEQTKAILHETYPFFLSLCTSVTQKSGEGERKVITEESFCFDYNYNSNLQSTVDSTISRLLSPHSPDASVRAMLTNLRTCAVSVSLLRDTVTQGDDERPYGNRGFDVDAISSVEVALDAIRRGLLESEPFFCLNTSQHFRSDLSTVEKDKASRRLQDITPSCVLLQQQRAALLRSPESSNFDTLIVISSSTSDLCPESDSGYSSGGVEFWDTTNNFKYISCLLKSLQQVEGEVTLVIPAHRALLSAGSGKLAAMIRFAILQGSSHKCADCGREQHVLLLQMSIGDRQEDLCDFKDLIWFMYTGVLREPHPQLSAREMAARMLRLLWLADQYLMSALTRLLEYRMLRDLCPENAPLYFMAAHSMQMVSLRLAAGLSVIYAPGDAHFGKNVEIIGGDFDDEKIDLEKSTAPILLEILRMLALSPH